MINWKVHQKPHFLNINTNQGFTLYLVETILMLNVLLIFIILVCLVYCHFYISKKVFFLMTFLW